MRFELSREYIDRLRTIIISKDEKLALELMEELHAADIAEIYDELEIEEAKFLYLLLDGEKAADVLAELEDDDRDRFLKAIPSRVIARQFIDNMDSDDAADIIGDLPNEIRGEVLSFIEDLDQAGDIVDLLNYDDDTAGGLMAKELIIVNMCWTVAKCIEEIRKHNQDIDEIFYIYVVDDGDRLKGVLPLQNLILSQPNAIIGTQIKSEVISVDTEMKSEEVAHVMDKYSLVVLPVVDSIGRLVGRITIDDVVDVIREEAERDYQMVSGITEDVEPSDKIWMLTRARLPWLFIGLFGGILGANVIAVYEYDLANHAAMAFFIPLIAAMGGNVGVQSSSIIVQGLASNTIGFESTWKRIIKEVSVALINGLSCSTVIFLYNIIFTETFALTITVSLALFIVILFASIFGTFVPLALIRFKIDPALATGPFITTVNDICGLFIYLMIARFMFTVFVP